ncbi:MAG: class I SAM-dependent methyltransferase [Sphingomonadales bacterium]
MAERKNTRLAIDADEAPANYEELFQLRGATYDGAMTRFPDARREEFLNTIARAGLGSGARVADVPAGGGYLARYLPSDCTWLGHEPCASFGHGATELDRDLLPLPWSDASIDAALSIAGVHHLDDKTPLFAELARVVRPGGRLVLADVHEASAVAQFLDGWVDRHNSTGHVGSYLGDHTLGELRRSGWEVLSAERVPFHWRFSSVTDMGEFAHRLFDLRTSAPSETARTIAADLGVDALADGIGMRWELYMVTATPRTAGR